jgi:hypothetical protein
MEIGREMARIGTLHSPVGIRRTVKKDSGPRKRQFTRIERHEEYSSE